jgi:hypothetical protein
VSKFWLSEITPSSQNFRLIFISVVRQRIRKRRVYLTNTVLRVLKLLTDWLSQSRRTAFAVLTIWPEPQNH